MYSIFKRDGRWQPQDATRGSKSVAGGMKSAMYVADRLATIGLSTKYLHNSSSRNKSSTQFILCESLRYLLKARLIKND